MENTMNQQNMQGQSPALNIYQKLGMIQNNLKAPKNMYNSYGKYNYRNAEGILEALKPHLAQFSAIVLIEDSIEHIGEIVTQGENGSIKKTPNCYIKATVKFIDCESGQEISASAYAHECEHKGMSLDQCTGTASSYARKYALNALFLLDDTKDSDTDEMRRIEDAAQQRNGNQQRQQNGGQQRQPNNNGRQWGGQQNVPPPNNRQWGGQQNAPQGQPNQNGGYGGQQNPNGRQWGNQ